MNNQITLGFLAEKLKQPKKTLILCHQNPDPDTLGSAFGLKLILEYYGSVAKVCCSDIPPKRLSFITEGDSLEYDGCEHERIVAVDVASPKQLGALSYLSDKTELTIDHHEMCTRFSTYYEELCASCAEIIYSLARELGIARRLGKRFYECIYAGMSGDTGGFRYSNTTSRTMLYASEIIDTGIDHSEINRIIFDSKSVEEIRAQRLTYENMQLLCDGSLAMILFTKKMKEENSLCDSDLGDIVNCIRGIDGVLVAVSIKESSKEEGRFFISSRANVDIDVSAVCQMMGGGGHKRAAGATLEAESPEAAFEHCSALFAKKVNEYKESL